MKTNYLVRVFLLAGLVLFSTQIFAQNSFEIRGKVVKSNTEVENHAKVYLLDSKTMELVAEQTSNENAEFVFEDVKKGEYILVVVKPGYKKPDTRIIVINEKGAVLSTPNNEIAESASNTENQQLN